MTTKATDLIGVGQGLGLARAARLAGALLLQLRYEQGNIDEAERLLDASVELGSAVGVGDFMIATYATGARVKASRLDHESAIRRLDEGDRVASARSLPRLTASVEHERVRLGYNAFRESSPRGPGFQKRFRSVSKGRR